LEARIASHEARGGAGPAGGFFRPESAAARDFGTRLHALCEQIEWLAPGEIPALPGAAPADRAQLVEFLGRPALHRLFERPDGRVELLREQAFEVVLDGQWLSGKIDRLELERDADGRPIRARVFDFKTDQTPNVERHRPQMDDYRRAVARLFALAPAQVAGTLLFLRAGEAREC
jgi:hypothetical protein